MNLSYEDDKKGISLTYNDKEIKSVEIYSEFLETWVPVELTQLTPYQYKKVESLYLDLVTGYDIGVQDVKADGALNE